jgi:hypothetical protein
MKLWFRFALVCLASVCLLLSLSQQAGSNYQLPVARSGPGLDRCRESASATAAVGKIMEFHPARAGPLESLVLDCALTKSNIDPFCLEAHGPPDNGTYEALASCSSSRQLKDKKQLIEQPFSTLHEISGLQPTKMKKSGFWWSREQAQWLQSPGGSWLGFRVAASVRFDMALFPVPAHRTGRADFPHPALGESSRRRPRKASGPFGKTDQAVHLVKRRGRETFLPRPRYLVLGA